MARKEEIDRQEPMKLDRSRWETHLVEKRHQDRHERFEEVNLSEVLTISKTENALDLVRGERCRQDSLWGDQSGNHPFEWMSILGEEYGELCEAVNETFFKNATHPERGGFEKIVKEATQVAAVAVAIIEAAQRKLGDVVLCQKPEGF